MRSKHSACHRAYSSSATNLLDELWNIRFGACCFAIELLLAALAEAALAFCAGGITRGQSLGRWESHDLCRIACEIFEIGDEKP
jgi:hypothetical protein